MSLDAVILRLAAYLAVIMAVGLVSSAVTVFVVLHNGNLINPAMAHIPTWECKA